MWYVPNVKVVWPNKEALLSRLAFDPASSRVVDTTLLALATSTYPAPAYSVFELGTLSPQGVAQLTPQFFASHHFDYAVVDRFGTQYPALEQMLAKGEVVARFPQTGAEANIFADNFPGPALLVFAMHQMGPEIWIVKLTK